MLFLVASLTCALSWSLPTLTAARLLQGVGASAIMSVNTALISAIYPHHRLGRGLGLNALIVGISFAVGPTVASRRPLAWPHGRGCSRSTCRLA